MEPQSPPGEPRESAELARIESAYRDRDLSHERSPYVFTNPGYAFYMQLLEWSLLEALRRSPVEIDQARVLDVGCGTGYLLHRLVEFGAGQATGVDLMPERIESARRRYPGARFVCASAAQLPFETGEFDIVSQFVCFSSVLDPDLRQAIAAEMWRVLRPGGIVVSYDMRPEPWPLRVRGWLGGRRHRPPGPSSGLQTPTTAISAGELKRLFPAGALRYAAVGLDFELCAISARSYGAARLLASIPLLRAHAIGVLVKRQVEPAGVCGRKPARDR